MIKKILILCTFVVPLMACASSQSKNLPKVPSSNPVFTAYEYIDLQERKNRQEIKDLIGIDPVRYEWCAAFVNAILEKHNLPTSDTVSDNPLMARSFLKLGEEVEIPRRGDIVVFPRGNQGWQGHVGFYVDTRIVGGKEWYVILGGNQDDSVSIDLYLASKALSIRRIPKPR
jgi:uncharacterized protein (TIGR02594 family)